MPRAEIMQIWQASARSSPARAREGQFTVRRTVPAQHASSPSADEGEIVIDLEAEDPDVLEQIHRRRHAAVEHLLEIDPFPQARHRV